MCKNYELRNIALGVGQKVRLLRQQRGLSCVELAELSGVSLSTVRRVELGFPSVSVTTIFDIARALGIHPKELFVLNRARIPASRPS